MPRALRSLAIALLDVRSAIAIAGVRIHANQPDCGRWVVGLLAQANAAVVVDQRIVLLVLTRSQPTQRPPM
jgi:hypothetical protein